MKKIFTLTALSVAQETKAPIQLTQTWAINGLSQPESVLATPDSDWVYISNVNGKDAGFISRVSKSGKVNKLHWVDGMQDPTGMALDNGKLYVVNKQEVVVIDSQSATIEQRIPTTGKWINDIAVTNDGIFYVGDLVTGQIFTFKAGDTAMQPWLQNEAIKHANGLLVDGDSLIVGTVGTELAPQLPPEKWGSLYRVSLADKSVELMANSAFKGNFDGVMKFGNGLLTTVSQQGKTYVEQDGQFIEIPQPIAGNITDGSLVDGAFYAPYMMNNQVINYIVK